MGHTIIVGILRPTTGWSVCDANLTYDSRREVHAYENYMMNNTITLRESKHIIL